MRRDLLVPGRDETRRSVAFQRRQEGDVRVAAEPKGLMHATVRQEMSYVVGNRGVHAHLRARFSPCAPGAGPIGNFHISDSGVRYQEPSRLGVAVSSLLAVSSLA